MSTSKAFHDTLMDRLSAAGDFSSIRMMGEYCIYYRDKVIGLLCDDQLLLKPTDAVLKALPDAERRYPYVGSKTLMVIVDEWENATLLATLAEAMYDELPAPAAKKGRKKTEESWMPASATLNRKPGAV